MTGPRFIPLAASLPATVPFVGPEAQERARGRRFAARIGANKSGFGLAPSVVSAIAEAASGVWMYGDPENHVLTQALADHHAVPPEAIMVGEGIDGLLGYLVRLLVGPGDAAVTSAGAYPTFNYHVAGFGGALHLVPYLGDHEDPDALLARAAAVDAKLVYFANPDNPMGSWHDAATVSRAIEAVPDGCVLLLDEAYIELAPDGTAPAFDVTDKRVIRMRTFSKAHGLAGLRIGYAIAHPELTLAFNKVRNHFGVSRISQVAAFASLADQSHLAQTIARVTLCRDRIARIARENGLEPLPSATNFVAIDCGQDGARSRALLQALIEQDIFVRMPFCAPQDRCIRISCGPQQDMDLFATALPKALASLG